VIDSLRSISTPEAEIDYFPYLNVGERVYVRAGVFKGVEGFIIRKDENKCRVVISVDALMASISVQVDSNLVEKL
jgi:transcription antitermination factor NusG